MDECWFTNSVVVGSSLVVVTRRLICARVIIIYDNLKKYFTDICVTNDDNIGGRLINRNYRKCFMLVN